MGQDSKSNRGELGEIRTQLAALASGGSKPDAAVAKRDLFKKIINYMTIGIDMSSLFMQVMTAGMSNAEDVVLKKQLYLFICTYAVANPDLTLLTINLLTKDCRDQDPSVRGLALRSLCSLRVANLIEYIMSPISMGLQDGHHYVRRTAVLGVLKVYNLDASAVRNAGMLEDLKTMLQQDPDAQVVANCMSVLLADFSEWAQCQVLEFVRHYRPTGEQEVYDIMNVLDDRLSHSNSAVVMATVKVFLHFTLSMPATHQQVLERIRDPLMTLVSRDHYETAYTVLCHFLLIVQRAPVLFSQIFQTFFCRMNEPSYIKHTKLEILAALADQSNAYDIVTELTEYVNDIDEKLARKAIQAVGQIALSVSEVPGIIERLLGFLEIGKDFVTAETVIQIKDLMRRYPDAAEVCVGSVANISPADVEEPEAKAAVIWILGEHGYNIQDAACLLGLQRCIVEAHVDDLIQIILSALADPAATMLPDTPYLLQPPDAPYLLEPVVDTFDAEEVPVRLALLSAVAKLFFKRPPECQKLLGKALAAAAADSNQDVHDRALLYHRLLQHSVAEARRVIATQPPPILQFAEEQSPELRDRIFDEFNSLAVVYQAPSSTFLQEKPQEEEDLMGTGPVGPGPVAPVAVPAIDEGSSLLSDYEQAEAGGEAPTANGGPSSAPQQPAVPSSAAPQIDMLDLDDLLSGVGPSTPPAQAAPPPPPPRLELRQNPQLTPQVFQQKWGTLSNVVQFSHQLTPGGIAAVEANSHQDFCRRVMTANVAVMASGGAPPTYRFYFHGQRADREDRVLIETVINRSTGTASVTVKADDAQTPDQFATVYKMLLSNLA